MYLISFGPNIVIDKTHGTRSLVFHLKKKVSGRFSIFKNRNALTNLLYIYAMFLLHARTLSYVTIELIPMNLIDFVFDSIHICTIIKRIFDVYPKHVNRKVSGPDRYFITSRALSRWSLLWQSDTLQKIR